MLEYQRLQFFQNHLHFSRPSKDVCFWSGQTRRSFYEASEVGQKEIQSTGSRWARKSTSRCKMKICITNNNQLTFGAWAYHPTFTKETFNLEGGDVCSKALTWSLTNAILRWDCQHCTTSDHLGWNILVKNSCTCSNASQAWTRKERRLFDTLRCPSCYFSRWWFQIFVIFIPTWGRFPFWLIFFTWVETTNQFLVIEISGPCWTRLVGYKLGNLIEVTNF